MIRDPKTDAEALAMFRKCFMETFAEDIKWQQDHGWPMCGSLKKIIEDCLARDTLPGSTSGARGSKPRPGSPQRKKRAKKP